METRAIGSLQVSVLGLGCNDLGRTVDDATSVSIVRAAVDAGITYFDTADIYGEGRSEEVLGQALAGCRDDVVIATKFGAKGSAEGGLAPGDPAWMRIALDRSLTRLGVDRIDHYQLHYFDPDTPLADTMGALHELVLAGKVRELGCSNFTADQLVESAELAAREGWTPFRTVQNRYSAITRAPQLDGTLAACRSTGARLVPYFPLELGMLTGKYSATEPVPAGSRRERWDPAITNRFYSDEKIEVATQLDRFARCR
jgi:aryl-alcohol dehydrogenase-like predicted oxidoreductase